MIANIDEFSDVSVARYMLFKIFQTFLPSMRHFNSFISLTEDDCTTVLMFDSYIIILRTIIR